MGTNARGWFESIKVAVAYNQHEDHQQTVQWGGTSIWSIDNAIHCAIESGADLSGLGRSSWTWYQGCGNVRLRVISAYRPCLSHGPLTVYAQHQNYFDSKDIEGCPRDLFTSHLLEELNTWIASSDQIILMMDANEDIRIHTNKHFNPLDSGKHSYIGMDNRHWQLLMGVLNLLTGFSCLNPLRFFLADILSLVFVLIPITKDFG